MLDDPHNVSERLWRAVDVLATSARPIRSRLESAAIILAPLMDWEFENPRAHALVTSIRERLTAGGGSYAESILQMSDEQAEAVAREIVELASLYLVR